MTTEGPGPPTHLSQTHQIYSYMWNTSSEKNKNEKPLRAGSRNSWVKERRSPSEQVEEAATQAPDKPRPRLRDSVWKEPKTQSLSPRSKGFELQIWEKSWQLGLTCPRAQYGRGWRKKRPGVLWKALTRSPRSVSLSRRLGLTLIWGGWAPSGVGVAAPPLPPLLCANYGNPRPLYLTAAFFVCLFVFTFFPSWWILCLHSHSTML